MTDESSPKHFKGKDAINHVVEAQAQGIAASAESHGAESPGHISAGADAARETAVFFMLLAALLMHLEIPQGESALIIGIFGFCWLLWRSGRSAWLGWFRLERLHRIVAEEKWEIEHNRPQERLELKELYAAKGFQGQLLDDVVDVLMADGDRLLKVMVEEELGLTLESQEHPLKQALGAAFGVIATTFISLAAFILLPSWGVAAGSFVALALAGAITAIYEKNKVIPAIIWNLGLGALAYGAMYFLLDYFYSPHAIAS